MSSILALLCSCLFFTPDLVTPSDIRKEPIRIDSIYLKTLLIYLKSDPDYQKAAPFCLLAKTKLIERYIPWEREDEEEIKKSLFPGSLILIEGNKFIGMDTIAIRQGADLAAIERSRKLPRSLIETSLPVEFWNKRKSSKLFKKDVRAGWDKFYQTRPNSIGIIEMSEVVFDASGQYAVVYIQHSRHALNAAGMLLVIDWEEQEILNRIELWVS